MRSVSESPARQRLRIELWSWSAWLILAIISYPALLLIWVAPRAGLLGGLVTGLLVAYTASLGHSGRKELERWLAAAALSGAAALVVGAVASFADRAPPHTALLCGLIVVAETMFAWNFLPWLVRDAEQGGEEAKRRRGEIRLSTPRLLDSSPRPALGLVLMLALLALGLGSAWSRGEAHVPNPTAWIIALGVLCLAFMFVERLAFFERAGREGNLLMAPDSYRSWLSVALAVLLLAAAVATALPRKHAKEESEASHIGSAAAASAAQSAGEKLTEAAESLAGAARAGGAGLQSAAAGFNSALLALLLLLLLSLILLRAFRRSRALLTAGGQAARWLMRVTMALLAFAARLWRRMRDLLDRRQASCPTSKRVTPPQDIDPLQDIFAQPDALAGLSAREIAIRTYHLLLSFAEMLGHGRRDGQTPFEYARALERALLTAGGQALLTAGGQALLTAGGQAAPSAAESILALTWAYSGAMYGGESTPLADPSSVRDSWQRLSSALASGMTEEELALRRRAYLAARRLRPGRE